MSEIFSNKTSNNEQTNIEALNDDCNFFTDFKTMSISLNKYLLTYTSLVAFGGPRQDYAPNLLGFFFWCALFVFMKNF